MFLSVLERVNIAMRGLNLGNLVVECRELGERGTKFKCSTVCKAFKEFIRIEESWNWNWYILVIELLIVIVRKGTVQSESGKHDMKGMEWNQLNSIFETDEGYRDV